VSSSSSSPDPRRGGWKLRVSGVMLERGVGNGVARLSYLLSSERSESVREGALRFPYMVNISQVQRYQADDNTQETIK
jgi:hypothetical protein